MPPLSQPPMPPSLGQPPVPLPTIRQPPIGIPPPPPPVGIPPVGQQPIVHPIMGQPPILNQTSLLKPPLNSLSINQPVIPPSMGLPPVPPINQPPVPLSIRGDLMPLDEKIEMEIDQEESGIQEPECEPPAPGTEEPPIQDLAPTPSKFLFCFFKIC